MDFRTNRGGHYNPQPRRQDPPAEARPEPAARPADSPPRSAAAPAAKRHLKRPEAAAKWKRPAKWLAVLILAAFIAWLVHGYITTRNQLEQAKSPSAGQGQAQQLVGKVGRLVDLPQGETPTIATVNDASKLKSQAFFAGAKDGDKVLIYSKAGKAVLYRPSTDKIIEYSTVNLSGGTGQ